MTKRGPKPKPAALRLVTGSHRPRRHGPKETATPDLPARDSGLEKPAYLQGGASQAWDLLIAPATWLDGFRMPAAVALCELWSEFMQNPPAFQAARHAQMRHYMADLGLTDERNRSEPPKPADPADRFFT